MSKFNEALCEYIAQLYILPVIYLMNRNFNTSELEITPIAELIALERRRHSKHFYIYVYI